MTAEPDRRVRKTRQALRHALLALVLEKGYESVTVQDIIDRADVGRSTFYAHFTDKQDLLRSGFDALEAMLREACVTSAGQRGRLFGFSLAFFRHCQENQELYWALVGKPGGGLTLRWFEDILADLVREELTRRIDQKATAVPLDAMVPVVVGGYLSLLRWWVDNGARERPEDLDRMFHALLTPGITKALHQRGASP
jgi:AcrR family transcriptional regulator